MLAEQLQARINYRGLIFAGRRSCRRGFEVAASYYWVILAEQSQTAERASSIKQASRAYGCILLLVEMRSESTLALHSAAIHTGKY